jgi:hypothetical protein
MYWNGVHFGLKKSTPIHFGMVARGPHGPHVAMAALHPHRTHVILWP